MARELIFLCSICREPAEHLTVPIAIEGAKERYIDLCRRHHRELVRPVVTALAEYGFDLDPEIKPPYVQRGTSRKIGPFQCKAGCGAPPLKHKHTLQQHLFRIHDGMTLARYVEKYGDLVPMTPEEEDAAVAEVRCDHCDQVYSTETGTRWPHSALIAHMRGRHGIGITEPAKP